MRRACAALLFGTMLAGCTYTANVAPTSSPAGEVILQKQVEVPTSYFISEELVSLTRTADEGFTCSAHKFPISAGPAIASSIRTVNQAAFKDVTTGGTLNEGASGAQRHIVFELDSFVPRLHFEQGFFSGTAIANVELAMKVAGYDNDGLQLIRTIVSGSGYGEAEGGCDAGADALATATNQAIKRAMENYVNRIINAGEL